MTLTDKEVETLKVFDETFGRRAALAAAGRRLADQLRQDLPDVDDLTLGRVALNVGGTLAGVAMDLPRLARARGGVRGAREAEAAISVVAGQYACAAIQLTEIHWKDMPS